MHVPCYHARGTSQTHVALSQQERNARSALPCIGLILSAPIWSLSQNESFSVISHHSIQKGLCIGSKSKHLKNNTIQTII